MKTEHTPGPWIAEPDGQYDWKVRSDDWGTIVNRNCYPSPDVDTNTEADARLIAAAPELLEALRNLLAYSNKYSDTMAAKLGRGAEELGELADSSSVAGMARAAIAKATGGDHA